MTFKLRIKGRDYFKSSSAANSANPLILTELEADLPTMAANDATVQDLTQHTISRLAGLADQAIEKAKEKNPESHFQVADYNDFNLMNSFNPDIIIMAELTWYVLDSLDEYISNLKSYAILRKKPTFFIHLLATYEEGTQKYGSDKFTNLDEILAYFKMQYLESGFIKTLREDDEKSQGTYFIAKLG